MTGKIAFELNGAPMSIEAGEARTLLWAIRTDTPFTGTKYGCGEAICGACTVLVDDVPRRACSVPLAAVAGKRVTTIEGLSKNGVLHPLQEAFVEHGALQCGYCTSGMLLTAYALLREKPHPARQQIVDALQNNLCRCGAHKRIVAAVEDAARKLGGRP